MILGNLDPQINSPMPDERTVKRRQKRRLPS